MIGSFYTHMFTKADRDDPIVPAPFVGGLPVIGLHNPDRQSTADIADVANLFVGDVVRYYLAPMLQGKISREASEAAAKLKNSHARLHMKLAGDKFQLSFLSLIQVRGIFPVGAGDCMYGSSIATNKSLPML